MKLVLLGATGVSVAGLVLIEVLLRRLFGFGNPLLYVADSEIGYLLAPNQKIRRFGNRIDINEYSMRSASFSRKRPERGLRVLMIGDSIVNGGWWTDQQDVLSELVARQLRVKKDFSQIEVLNASANSWAPRNELAYLRRFGLFDAQVVVLVINTDDLFGAAPNSRVIGHDRNYPDRKFPLALMEVVSRLLPARPLPPLSATQEQRDPVGANLEAIRQIHVLAQQANARLVLAMTPLLREVSQLGSRDYEIAARQRLLKLTEVQQIPYIDFLTVFKVEAEHPQELYRDHIHLSPAGHDLVSDWIGEFI